MKPSINKTIIGKTVKEEIIGDHTRIIFTDGTIIETYGCNIDSESGYNFIN